LVEAIKNQNLKEQTQVQTPNKSRKNENKKGKEKSQRLRLCRQKRGTSLKFIQRITIMSSKDTILLASTIPPPPQSESH